MKFKDLFGLRKTLNKDIKSGEHSNAHERSELIIGEESGNSMIDEESESITEDKGSESIIEDKGSENSTIDIEYYFGKYKLMLKGFHDLAKFQKEFPLYDQFLPIFCRNFNGLIIDIGANIGDTAIAIFSKNDDSFIVSVEPDIDFYNECVFNVSNNDLNDRSLIVNKFVSTKTGSFVVKKSESLSTGSIDELKQETSEINNTISFSGLMDLVPQAKKEIFDILKIDTDSFDWDVIQSFAEYAKKGAIKPRFVFFEMQTFLNNNENSYEGRHEIIDKYKQALIELKTLGYTKFCLFDNFGTYFKTTESIDEIIELAFYIQRSQLFNSHSTVYYFDILTYSENENVIVNDTISEIYKYEPFS